MNISRLLKQNRSAILEIAAKHGARNVRVFGSAARGQETAGSDLDLLVELEPSRTLLDHAGLVLDLQDLLGIELDVVTEKGIKERIRQRVLEEAVQL